MKSYPKAITGDFTWHADRGLALFSHGARSIEIYEKILSEYPETRWRKRH